MYCVPSDTPVYPSVYPSVYPGIADPRPHYEDLAKNFPAASPDLLQMAPVLAFLQYGANIWTDKQSRCLSILRNIFGNNSTPSTVTLGCGPFTSAKSNRWRGFFIRTELLLLPTSTPGLKVGQKFLLAATREKFEGITTVNTYRTHPVADFFTTFSDKILDLSLQLFMFLPLT